MRATAGTLLAIALAMVAAGMGLTPAATTGWEFFGARALFIGAAVALVISYIFWLADNRRKVVASIAAPFFRNSYYTCRCDRYTNSVGVG